ncbi:MAG: hypothetical protein DBX40_06930 [Clostridiales bacterium]|nr:MAG: hypothetical protein DBX40_06930 [Clostridiales bacterium]
MVSTFKGVSITASSRARRFTARDFPFVISRAYSLFAAFDLQAPLLSLFSYYILSFTLVNPFFKKRIILF